MGWGWGGGLGWVGAGDLVAVGVEKGEGGEVGGVRVEGYIYIYIYIYIYLR